MAGVVVVALCAPAASHAEVTIGSDLSRTANVDHNCDTTTGCTIVQTVLPGRQLTAPFGGAIVRWRVKGYGTGTVTLRVLRQLTFGSAPPFTYSFLRSSAAETSGSPGVVTYEPSAPIPISAGDTIAVTASGDNAGGANLVSGAHDVTFAASPDDGTTGDSSSLDSSTFDWLYNADIVGPPTSSATAAPCPGGASATVAVHADSDPATGPKSAHFRIDGGPEQTIATTGNPAVATITLPSGVHSIEYWGEDQLGLQEATHHTISAGCAASGRPALSAAKLSSKAFRAATSGPSLSRTTPVGTTVSYTDNEPSITTFRVLRPSTGHRGGTRCVAGRPHGKQRRCTRYVLVGKAFTHRDAAGPVTVHFSGRVKGRKLRAGSYRLTLTPRAASKTGRAVKLSFRIVR